MRDTQDNKRWRPSCLPSRELLAPSALFLYMDLMRIQRQHDIPFLSSSHHHTKSDDDGKQRGWRRQVEGG